MVVEVDKVKDNLYVLKGGGGNTAVFITANGVVVVDAKNPGGKEFYKVKELTPKPITMPPIPTPMPITWRQRGVPRRSKSSRRKTRKPTWKRWDIFKQNNGRGMARKTFKDKMTLMKGADQIDLYYFGPGHTNGDAIVVFPALRTAHIGDLFASKSLPLVDADNGGSVLHYPETLNKVLGGIKNVDTLINGHMPATTTWADLKTFAEFNQDFLTWAQGALKSGKTPEQAAAGWKVPEKYAGYSSTVSPLFGGVAGRLQRLAEETKK